MFNWDLALLFAVLFITLFAAYGHGYNIYLRWICAGVIAIWIYAPIINAILGM